MFKTAEIDRRARFACPRPRGGRGAALAIAVGVHAIVAGALAAISAHSLPATSPTGEIEATFAPAARHAPDAAVPLSARSRPVLVPATELQLHELPYFPDALRIAGVELAAAAPEPIPEIGGEFVPWKLAPRAETEGADPRQPQADRPPRKARPAPAAEARFTPASVVRTARPAYPESARQKGHAGISQVRLSIDAAGSVTAASISQSSGHAALDASALKAARRWKFKPATSGGMPVATAVIVPIRFAFQ